MRRLALTGLLAVASLFVTASGASPAGSGSLTAGVGPFWYMRTIGAMRAPRCVKPLPGVMHPCGATVAGAPRRRETAPAITSHRLNGGPPDVPGPDSTLVVQGPVGSIAALPPGVRPIRGVGKPPLWPSPPAPAVEAMSPAVGRPSTAFTLLVAATVGDRAHPAPTAWLSVTGSAGYGIYPGVDGGSDPCLPRTSVRIWPATTIHRAGRLVYVYRIGPGRFHVRTWCAGRNEVGIQTFPNPLPPRYTTPPYTGPSGT